MSIYLKFEGLSLFAVAAAPLGRSSLCRVRKRKRKDAENHRPLGIHLAEENGEKGKTRTRRHGKRKEIYPPPLKYQISLNMR